MTSPKLDRKIKATSDDPIWHLHEYDVDLQSNHIYLMGMEDYAAGHEEGLPEPGIEYTIANRFIRNLNLCMRVNPTKPVVIHMKTCGGDWVEGMAIYDAIKSCPTPVTILSYTHARSMSSLIFQAANKRVMMPHSYFMYHDGTTAYSGTVKTVDSNKAFQDKASVAMLDIYVDSMKRNGKMKHKSRKAIYAYLKDQMDKREDVFLNPKETVVLGLADSIFDYNWSKLIEYSEEELSRG